MAGWLFSINHYLLPGRHNKNTNLALHKAPIILNSHPEAHLKVSNSLIATIRGKRVPSAPNLHTHTYNYNLVVLCGLGMKRVSEAVRILA